MALDIEQGNDPVLHAKLVDAIKQTGHVAHDAAHALADAVLKVFQHHMTEPPPPPPSSQ